MSGKVDNFSTNVLIIGKSGVGKSSLLNYIFDQNLAETGSGKPVTKEEIYKYSMKHPSGMTVYVFDTWGLEADKADRWTKLIMDEVTAHDCADICDWFHTILYCISAKSARIEDFERQQIKLLLDSGNRVIVCLTHCDARNVEQSISALTAELCAIGLTEKDIIQTVSVSKKLLGSKEAAPRRGREEILLKIQSNLWETVAAKLPAQLVAYSNKLIDEWYENCCNGANSAINKSNARSAEFCNSILGSASKHLRDNIRRIEAEYKKRASEAMDYYKNLCTAISKDSIELSTDFDVSVSMSEFFDYGDNMDKAIETIFHAIPGVGSFLNWLDVEDAKRQFEVKFRMQADELKSELARYFYSLSEKMMKQSPQNETDRKETRIIEEDIAVENQMIIENCKLEFHAMIYVSEKSKLIIRNCDISVSPSIPAAVYGNNAEIILENCRLTYHGSENANFIYGDDLNISFSDTEMNGCYNMYSGTAIYKPLTECYLNEEKYKDKNYNVPKGFRHYNAKSGTRLNVTNCFGKIDYSVVDKSISANSSIILKDSRFQHTGTKFDKNDYYIFACKSAEVDNCVFENFNADVFLTDGDRSSVVKNSRFANCNLVVHATLSHSNLNFENCEFENCKGIADGCYDKEMTICNSTFKNCCGSIFDCGYLKMIDCKLKEGLPFIYVRKDSIFRNCEFSNWSLRSAIPKLERKGMLPMMLGGSSIIENCIFSDLNLNDAGNLGSNEWAASEYLIASNSSITKLKLVKSTFSNVSVTKKIVRTYYQYIEEEEAFLPFLPPKRSVNYCNIDLTVENCAGINSHGEAK